jgi:hypothetical protein
MPATIISKTLWGGPGRSQSISFPTSLPLGETIIIGVVGQNLGPPTAMGLEWKISKPDGSIAQQFNRFDSDSLIKTNGKYNFQGPYLSLDKEGQWNIQITLSTGDINKPAVADKYEGLLVSVISSPSQLKGHFEKTLGRIKVGEKESGLPITIKRGLSGQLQLWAQNDMNTAQKMAAEWTIFDSEKKAIYTYPPSSGRASSWTEIPAGKWAGYTSQNLTFDKDGAWSVQASLLMNPDKPVTVDSFTGVIANVSR